MPAAAMKYVFLEVRKKNNGKGGTEGRRAGSKGQRG